MRYIVRKKKETVAVGVVMQRDSTNLLCDILNDTFDIISSMFFNTAEYMSTQKSI